MWEQEQHLQRPCDRNMSGNRSGKCKASVAGAEEAAGKMVGDKVCRG